jgi:hypothetical protein
MLSLSYPSREEGLILLDFAAPREGERRGLAPCELNLNRNCDRCFGNGKTVRREPQVRIKGNEQAIYIDHMIRGG